MENRDKKRFAEIMYGLAENFGGQLTPQGLNMRFDAMIDLAISQIDAAATHLVINREKAFPPVPTVKELRDAVEALESSKISKESRARIQADWVLMELKSRGREAKLIFEDPITESLMTRRWPYQSWWSTVTMHELEFWPKQFIDAYLAHNEQAEAEKIALPPGNNGKAVLRLQHMASEVAKAI